MSTSKIKNYLSAKARKLTRGVSPGRPQALRPIAGPSQGPSSPSVVTVAIPPNPNNKATTSTQRPVTPSNKSIAPDPALKDAIEKYAAELSDNDKSAFQSAGDIMDKLRAMDQADTSLSRSFGTRIEKVLQCIKNFVGSVAICIQHSPEISSLVVGGVNCVLLLVLGYIEFFESLTKMMERIGGHLSYLSEYGSRMFQSSPDVQNALVNAYCDLLDFFVAVRSVFTDKEGRVSSEKRRKVLEWLSPIDYEGTHQKHFKKHFDNTGQWLLNDPLFTTWKDALGSGLLWCHGMPGTGKTVLSSLVVEKLSAQYELSSNTGISFAYFNYKEPQDTTTYIRTFIKQLSRRMDELPVELETLYDKHYLNASNPEYVELQDVFIRISKCFQRVFLVIDALDECAEDQRREIFEVLGGIASSTKTSYGNTSPARTDHRDIKLFVASRKEPEIQRAFASFPIIEIEAKKVDADIKPYVIAQLDKYIQDGTLRLRDTSLKDKILTALLDRAGGMFLWIEFQLKHICSQTSDHDIEQALESLPEDMEQTYERIILLINKKPNPQRKLARRVLMWIAYATRPLNLRELQYAVAIENDTKSAEKLESMVPTTESLLGVCASLVVLDVDTFRYLESRVRFVHFSVQEFLLEKSLGPDNHSAVATLHIGLGIAHAEMAQRCITFLLFCREDTKYNYLVFYAEPAWKDHIRALTKINNDLMTLTLEFFKFGVFFEPNLPSYSPLYFLYYRRISHTNFSPVVIALILNLPLILEHLEKEQYDQQHYPDDLYAMHYAAINNSYKAAERLYNEGFSVSVLDGTGYTPLYYATSKDFALFLLDKGADLNAQGGEYRNPLQAAAYHSRQEVVQFLLDRGADVNAQGGEYGNALQAAAAAYIYSQEVVQLLLDRGADVNAQCGKYGNSLQAVVSMSRQEVVQLLLDRGVDVNAQGGKYGNALQAATAYIDNQEVIQLLLDRGADVNAQGGKYGNALQAAVSMGRQEVVQLLLNRGADVNGQEEFYGNKLVQPLLEGGTVQQGLVLPLDAS